MGCITMAMVKFTLVVAQSKLCGATMPHSCLTVLKENRVSSPPNSCVLREYGGHSYV